MLPHLRLKNRRYGSTFFDYKFSDKEEILYRLEFKKSMCFIENLLEKSKIGLIILCKAWLFSGTIADNLRYCPPFCFRAYLSP